MKILKGIGIILLIISMMYASNWDLPKETRVDYLANLEEEIEQYEQSKKCIEVNTGEYINGVWVEYWEMYGGPLPSEVLIDE